MYKYKINVFFSYNRYRYPAGALMNEVCNALKWADGALIKKEVDLQILTLLGPKTEMDLAPQPKVEKPIKQLKIPITKANTLLVSCVSFSYIFNI